MPGAARRGLRSERAHRGRRPQRAAGKLQSRAGPDRPRSDASDRPSSANRRRPPPMSGARRRGRARAARTPERRHAGPGVDHGAGPFRAAVAPHCVGGSSQTAGRLDGRDTHRRRERGRSRAAPRGELDGFRPSPKTRHRVPAELAGDGRRGSRRRADLRAGVPLWLGRAGPRHGVLPALLGVLGGAGLWVAWALFFSLECFSDLAALFAIARLPVGGRVVSHPTQLGCRSEAAG